METPVLYLRDFDHVLSEALDVELARILEAIPACGLSRTELARMTLYEGLRDEGVMQAVRRAVERRSKRYG